MMHETLDLPKMDGDTEQRHNVNDRCLNLAKAEYYMYINTIYLITNTGDEIITTMSLMIEVSILITTNSQVIKMNIQAANG